MDFPISSTSEELYKSFVSKELQLLTDFIADMIVVWVLYLKFINKGINFVQKEIVLWYSFYTFQHIHQPATTINTCLLQQKCPLVLVNNMRFVLLLTVLDNKYFATFRNVAYFDVAARPACSPCGICKRVAFLNDVWHKEELGDYE